ncbi:MAG: hypothetical protein KGO48_13370 [Alphaproteobacteria bacterium]|nr:hypothetical protein [Alphaproteobacteria bacterium]
MIGGQKHTQTEYLARAKDLRATAAQVRDRQVREALIHAAEAYERMTALWPEIGGSTEISR